MCREQAMSVELEQLRRQNMALRHRYWKFLPFMGQPSGCAMARRSSELLAIKSGGGEVIG
jgi:hypothetical protein